MHAGLCSRSELRATPFVPSAARTRCQPAAAAQELGPVSSFARSVTQASAAADGGSGLTQAQLDALQAVELDADSLALTSDEDVEALFKELNVSMPTKNQDQGREEETKQGNSASA
eukprot:g74480.t1